jgi:replicative DNA helicase
MPEFDDIMATGFDQMTLTVIVGDTGSFKTTTMMNIACGVCEKNNVDVLYVPLEMTAHQMYNKLVSRGANIPLNVLLKPKTYLTEDHINKIDKFEKEEEDREGRFALLDIGERTTVSAIRRQIEQSIHIVQPRLVVIDYVANLLPDRSHNGRHDLEIGDMLKDMLKMGKAGVVTEKGFGVVTAAQLGREALKRLKNQKDSSKMTLGSDDIQNSHQYSTDASAIFGLYRPSQDADKTLMVIPMKSRFGPKTYENTSNPNCALLTVQPEYSRVMTSQELDWSSNAEEILMKSSTPPKALQSQNNLDDWDFDEESGSAITVSANPVESEELQDLLS